MILRRATKEDVVDLRDIAAAAMPADPQWDFRFPRRKEFPQDTSYWTLRQYEGYLDAKNPKYSIMVITVDVDGDECHQPRRKPVALAVWDVSSIQDHGSYVSGEKSIPHSSPYAEGKCCRRDANVKRMDAFMQTMKESKKRYFDGVYGTDHIQLQVLATHPDYQRRGYATRLCKWGIDVARANDRYIIVFASPMGKSLYSHLGFRQVADVPVQADGEKEKVVLSAMMYSEFSHPVDGRRFSRSTKLDSGEAFEVILSRTRI